VLQAAGITYLDNAGSGLIVELRRQTTADILVGSLHWCVRHRPVWPDPEARNGPVEGSRDAPQPIVGVAYSVEAHSDARDAAIDKHGDGPITE
jgi:hypothetical protein